MLVKALSKDMTATQGNGMKYELGIWYKANGNIISCQNGFHFCKRIVDLARFYNLDDSRVFEVEIGNIEMQEGRKLVTNKIRLIREISKKEIKKWFKDNLKNLVKDEDCVVRREVARQGYALDILVNDEDWSVRLEVARKGYGLDILVNDKNWSVRLEVARKGYGLDILVNDEDWDVSVEAEEMIKYVKMRNKISI